MNENDFVIRKILRKFCLENYKNQELDRDYLKVITRFENHEELYIELN